MIFSSYIIEKLSFTKADERKNCPLGLVVENEDACKEAATYFGLTYSMKISSSISAPAGYYWYYTTSDEKHKLAFNPNTDPDKIKSFSRNGGLCWKGIMNYTRHFLSSTKSNLNKIELA